MQTLCFVSINSIDAGHGSENALYSRVGISPVAKKRKGRESVIAVCEKAQKS